VAYAAGSGEEPFAGLCVLIFKADGTWQIEGAVSGIIDSGAWLSPAAGMANYDVIFDLVSGGPIGGTTGTWQALSANRQVFVEPPSGTRSAIVRVRVRYSGGAALEDQNFFISATA